MIVQLRLLPDRAALASPLHATRKHRRNVDCADPGRADRRLDLHERPIRSEIDFERTELLRGALNAPSVVPGDPRHAVELAGKHTEVDVDHETVVLRIKLAPEHDPFHGEDFDSLGRKRPNYARESVARDLLDEPGISVRARSHSVLITLNPGPGRRISKCYDGPSTRTMVTTWTRTHVVGDQVVARFGTRGDLLVMEWPRVGRLQCSSDGRRATLTRLPNADAGSFGKLRGSVRALVGDLRGGLGLHAAAVAIRGKAILVVGPSGAGKSTAACELTTRHRGRLLADDAALVVLGRSAIRVEPTESLHCLWPEMSRRLGVTPRRGAGYHAKVFVRPKSTMPTGRAAPLGLIVALRFDDEIARPAHRPLAGATAAAYVLGAMFRLDDGPIEAQRLDRVQRLYERVPIVEIARPRNQPSVSDLIVELLASAA